MQKYNINKTYNKIINYYLDNLLKQLNNLKKLYILQFII